ncbi:MAG: DUF2059 domain-containing protein [Bacteroides sp.]|jgi:hypothetical protein|nr:DUF2059 domain-containing protein [Bacteroides sp.]MCI1682416.1 DUF2059 domain-containing protein [Bacteroides sp.]
MRKSLILLLMCGAALFAAVPSVSAQSQDNEYQETLGKMMSVSGALASVDAMLPQMVTMMKQSAPTVPESFWNGFLDKWKNNLGSRLAAFYTPVYQKYLTIDDLKKIIEFYESPVGKKLGEATPAMNVEGMKFGQQLGMEIAADLQTELNAKGNK